MKKLILALLASASVSANAHSQLQCRYIDGEFQHISNLQFRIGSERNDDVGHYQVLLHGKWTNAYVGLKGLRNHLTLGSVIDGDFESRYEICGEENTDGLAIAEIKRLVD